MALSSSGLQARASTVPTAAAGEPLASDSVAAEVSAGAGLGTPEPGDDIEAARVRAAVSASLLDEEHATPRIGRYAVLSKIGEGGMGVVYAAFDDALDRKVALKLLRAGEQDEVLRTRMVREAQALARLSDPHVVHVYEVGEHEGRTFLAMEFVRGATLRAWQKAKPRPWREIVAMYLQAGAGLAAAHAAGLVHRDFKPDNVLVGRDGRARVLDFGLAREGRKGAALDVGLTAVPAGVRGSDPIGAPLTRTGSMMGTPAYMAPEQFLGDSVDARTDQFAFCVALFEALYGERPFAGTTRAELIAAVTRGSIRPASRGSAVPPWLRATVVRGLSVSPADRFADMPALLAALGRDPARTRRRAGLAAVAVAGVAAVVIATRGPAPAEPCGGAEAALAEVVDDDRVSRVLAAIDGSGLSFAGHTRARIQAELDRFRTTWVDGHRDACEATAVRREQSADLLDRRMACLHAARTELGAVLGVIETPTPAVVENAIELVERVPDPLHCSDAALLRDGPPPPAPELVDEVEALRAELVAAGARLDILADDATRTQLDGLIARADALGYTPLRAWARYHRIEPSKASDAVERLREVHALALTARDDELALRSASMQGLMLAASSQLPQGREWAELADAWLSRVSVSPDVRRGVVANRVGVENGAGQYATARQLAEAELARAEHGEPVLSSAGLRVNLGTALLGLGETERAVAEADRARAELEVILGPAHPSLADVLNLRAAALVRSGRIAEGRDCLRGLVELVTRASSAEDPRLLTPLANLAEFARLAGGYDEAIERGRTVRAVRVRTFGERSEQVAASDYNLANALLDAGRSAEALPHIERAFEIRTEVLGAEHPKIPNTLVLLAEVRLAAGDVDGAARDAQRALVLAERAYPPGHAAIDTARASVANAMAASGDHAGARRAIDAVLASVGDAATHHGASVWLQSARLAEQANDVARAREHYRKGLALAEGVLPATHARVRVARERVAALGAG